MKIHNIVVKKIDKIVELGTDELKHIKVLRLRDNERVRLLDGKGNIGEGKFNGKYIKVEKVQKAHWEPNIYLYLPFVKQHAHRLILRNITSFPIKTIIFYDAKNSVAQRKFGKHDENLLKESMKQSGNPYLPRIDFLTDLKNIEKLGAGYFGSIYGIKKLPQGENREITIVVGPEGGLTKNEENILNEKGFIPISVSPAVLRTEIAVFALCALTEFRF